MRYESALQIVRYLKQVYGTPVPILRIAQNIDLSYQPTYKHVRALQALGVIRAEKLGRDVLCCLAASDATHLWLGLLAVQQRSDLLSDPALAGLVLEIRRHLRFALGEGVLAVALRRAAAGPELLAITVDTPDDQLEHRLSARCTAGGATIPVTVLDRAAVADAVADDATRVLWVAQCVPIYGEQVFWALALTEDGCRQEVV